MNAVLAVAIEDSVQLWYRDLEGLTKPEKWSREIPEKFNYCKAVHGLLNEMLRDLRKRFPDTSVLDLFNSISSTVVSVPGVIENHRRLVQIPVWNYIMVETRMLQWELDGKRKNGFDFPKELAAIVRKIAKEEGQNWPATQRHEFEKRAYVFNDATACAVFEESRRKRSTPAIYLKATNGINIGIAERNSDGSFNLNSTPEPEAGHGLPRRHQDDFDAGFEGVCVYHMCYEGLTAAHSFHERILKTQFEKFKAWKPKLDELKRERGLTGQKLDNALVDYLLGDDEKPPAGAAIELVGHYIGQLVYQLLLISPRQIVIGGHMARPRVVDEVRKIVRISAGDYPARPELTESGLKRHIVPSRARPHERYTVEIRGALEIALSRAKTKLSDQAVARS